MVCVRTYPWFLSSHFPWFSSTYSSTSGHTSLILKQSQWPHLVPSWSFDQDRFFLDLPLTPSALPWTSPTLANFRQTHNSLKALTPGNNSSFSLLFSGLRTWIGSSSSPDLLGETWTTTKAKVPLAIPVPQGKTFLFLFPLPYQNFPFNKSDWKLT